MKPVRGELPPQHRELLTRAAAVRAHAHAPYSGFRVGAAVLVGGRVFVGCNVENSAYPLSVCAERHAVAAAVAEGERALEAVGIVGGEGRPAFPCGGCRQVLAEFGDGQTAVYCADAQLHQVVMAPLGELLPWSFGASDLTVPKGRKAASTPGKARGAAPSRATRSSGRGR